MRPVSRKARERAHPDKPDPITEAVTEAINRLAAALEALPPALTQATRDAHQTEMARQRHALDFGR